MPRASNGVYTLPNTVNPVVPGTFITANWGNTTLNDVASVLTSCLDRLGRGAMQANLSMGSFKVTNLLDGTADSDAATKGQVDDLQTLLDAQIVALEDELTTGLSSIPIVTDELTAGACFSTTSDVTLEADLPVGNIYEIFNSSTSTALDILEDTGVTIFYPGTPYEGNLILGARGIATVKVMAANLYMVVGAGVQLA